MSAMQFPVIVGPTCVGKTGFVAHLVRAYPLEVINMDSFQVYSHFKIGTGRAEVQATPNHLYGFLDPNQNLSATEYLGLVEEAIGRILKNGRHPIFEGGSLTFLRALSARFQLRLVGIRPLDSDWIKQRIAERTDSLFESALLAEIIDGLERGYRNTRVLSDDVVYLPMVRYLDGKITLPEARIKMRENLFQMISRQMAEYDAFEIEWLYSTPVTLERMQEIIVGIISNSSASQ